MDFLKLELYSNKQNEDIELYKKDYPNSIYYSYMSIDFNKKKYLLLFECINDDIFYKVFNYDIRYNLIYSEKVEPLKKPKTKNKYYLMKYFLMNEFSNISTDFLFMKNNLLIFKTIFQDKETKYDKISLYIEKNEKEMLYIQSNEAIFYLKDKKDTLYERYYLSEFNNFESIYSELRNNEKINKEQDLLLNKIIHDI